MMEIRKKQFVILISGIFVAAAILLIGPLDFFTHGFYCDIVDWNSIVAEDFGEPVSLEDGPFQMEFSPKEDHFAGFGIYLVNQPEGNTGNLAIAIYGEDGRQEDSAIVDLSKVYASALYRVYTKGNLRKGKTYTAKFSAEGCQTAPSLPTVDPDYLSEESKSGNVLIGYGYAAPTFSFQNKALICSFILALYGIACSRLLPGGKKKEAVFAGSAALFLAVVLSWNYMYNSMDNANTSFSSFQADSETLVTGVIMAERAGIYRLNEQERGYGLGRYTTTKGTLLNYVMSYVSDGNWAEGYSRANPAILVNANLYTRGVVAAGNYVQFGNGDMFRIDNVEESGGNLAIHLNAEKALSPAKYGSLDQARFYNANKELLPIGLSTAYFSQYGLQGKVFRRLARHMDYEETVANLNLLCAAATAFVFVAIVWLVAKKYNPIMAAVFFGTFWLSPWVVNFARNLYWVEFTWFLPMAIGLFCAWKIGSKACRLFSYGAAFVAIAGRCLCGYEYISSIMMGLIAFLLVDFFMAVGRGDRKGASLILRTVAALGVSALLGFLTAICIHGSLRGGGHIWAGVKNIFLQDVLRRTNGGDLNQFSASVWPSFNASVWEVFCKYFKFSTEVVAGVTGNLFPLLCVAPLCIFAFDYKRGKLNWEHLAMYGVFFLTSISWFCLGKAHSYVHTHMNYVLWYLGFVQTCFYIILDKFAQIYKKISALEKGMG